MKECSICKTKLSKSEGVSEGFIGMISVSFCPTCFNGILDMSYDMSEWEEVNGEDLWEDGELSLEEVDKKILNGIHLTGEYKLFKSKEYQNIIGETK